MLKAGGWFWEWNASRLLMIVTRPETDNLLNLELQDRIQAVFPLHNAGGLDFT